MKRFLLTSLLMLAVVSSAFAGELSFVASAPKSVVANRPFRLSYKVDGTVNVDAPTMPETTGFTILSGPGRSTMQSYNNINGKLSETVSVTFTYTLMAEKEGEFTIPPATVVVDGEKLLSNEVTIKVLPDDGSSSSSSSSTRRGNNNRGVTNTNSTNISNDDLFVRAILNKTKVYEQEAVLLTYKVYSAVNLTNLDFPTPDLKGFHIQEVELPKEKQFELDRYNNRNYQSLVWRQFVLFPQQSGKVEIPPLTFEGVVAVQTRRHMDPFEMMFNGGPSYVEVKKNLKTNRLTLDVEKLPARPAGFSGGVGMFTISSELSKSELKTNEETTLKITLKGVGNMKLIGNPTVDFPSEFEVYDPIINNRFSLKTNGFAGEKVYEYVITPRSSGTFILPGASLSYFDTSTGTYKTITAQDFTINVEKGKETPVASATSYIGKEKSRVLATDIRHIKLGDVELQKENISLFASSYYMLFYIVPLLLFILYVVAYRKRMAENANISFVRTKKANKVAVKRLKIARALMKENKAGEFYDEILKTLWGYMSDKLSIPVSQLSKENIATELGRKGVAEELIAEIKNALNEGEFARYAPGDTGATMDKVYSMSMDVISKLENSIKK